MRFFRPHHRTAGAPLATGGGLRPLPEAARAAMRRRELVEDDPRFPALAQRFQQHSAGDHRRHRRRLDRRDGAPTTPIRISSKGACDSATPACRSPSSTRASPARPPRTWSARFPKDVYPASRRWLSGRPARSTRYAARTIDAFVDDPRQPGSLTLRRHNSEIILMDMQYNPSTVSVIDFEPYLDALRQTARADRLFMCFGVSTS